MSEQISTPTNQAPAAVPAMMTADAQVPVGGNVPMGDDAHAQEKPTAPPDFSMDAFDKELDGAYREPTPPKVEAKPEIKPSEKPHEQALRTDQGTDPDDSDLKIKPTEQQPKVVPAVTQQPKGRDYSGLDETEVKLFKKMDNEAFARLKPVYLESKQFKQKEAELKQQLEAARSGKEQFPDSWVEHPNAYMLSQTYQRGVQDMTMAQQVEQHWRQQLINIENGEDWKDIDIKDGKFVLSEAKAADAAAKADVLDNLQFAREQAQRANQWLQKYPQEFKQRNQAITQFVKRDIEDRYFPWFTEAELAKPEKAQYKQVIDNVIKSLPPELQKNSLSPVIAKAFAVISELNRQLEAASKSKEVATLNAKDKQLVPPNPTTVVSDPSGKKKGPSLEDFSRELD